MYSVCSVCSVYGVVCIVYVVCVVCHVFCIKIVYLLSTVTCMKSPLILGASSLKLHLPVSLAIICYVCIRFDKELDKVPMKCIDTLSWVISNICRKPYPAFEKVCTVSV